MGHVKSTISVCFLLVVLAVGFKIGWDEHQQSRAEAQVPAVRAIFADVEQFPGTTADSVYDESSISVNEYSTSLWRSFRTESAQSEIRAHFEREMERHGFAKVNEHDSAGRVLIEFRKGEFETRLLFDKDGYDFSVNWYGLAR